MTHSQSSNRATHGSSSNRSHSPVSDSTVTGADAGNHHRYAVSDMSKSHNGNVQLPAGRDDLTREIDEIWEKGDKLPAQMPRPSYTR